MNKHIKGFNVSKIKHRRKNEGFSELKFNDNGSQTACFYDPYIFLTLKPYYSVIPSYIKDGTDFLNKLPKLNKEEVKDILIVTCDIKDMYNNINRDLGIEALTFWLNKYPHLLHERFNSSFIIESIQFILENWCFHFNGNYFSLSQGTVTGTAVSPIYASLTIAFLELQM